MVNQQFATALHALTILGLKKGLAHSHELAEHLHTNPVVIRNIVGKLARAQIVETIRGKLGGVRLIKDPKTISLFEIYQCVEPAQKVICPREKRNKSHCVVTHGLERLILQISGQIDGEVEKVLERRNLAQVLTEVNRAIEAAR